MNNYFLIYSLLSGAITGVSCWFIVSRISKALTRVEEASTKSIEVCEKLMAMNDVMVDNMEQSHLKFMETYNALTKEAVTSYKHTTEACIASAELCESTVQSITKACEEAASVASKTCKELLHSAFPTKGLDWSWHSENSTMCDFCHQRFPNTEIETHGKYHYCKQHGTMRAQCLSS